MCQKATFWNSSHFRFGAEQTDCHGEPTYCGQGLIPAHRVHTPALWDGAKTAPEESIV